MQPPASAGFPGGRLCCPGRPRTQPYQPESGQASQSDAVLTSNLPGTCCDHPHFTDEETEGRQGDITAQACGFERRSVRPLLNSHPSYFLTRFRVRTFLPRYLRTRISNKASGFQTLHFTSGNADVLPPPCLFTLLPSSRGLRDLGRNQPDPLKSPETPGFWRTLFLGESEDRGWALSWLGARSPEASAQAQPSLWRNVCSLFLWVPFSSGTDAEPLTLGRRLPLVVNPLSLEAVKQRLKQALGRREDVPQPPHGRGSGLASGAAGSPEHCRLLRYPWTLSTRCR